MKEQDHATRPDPARAVIRPQQRQQQVISTGSAPLDAAIAVDRDRSPDIATLLHRCQASPGRPSSAVADTRSFVAGRPASVLALTDDRHGHGPTLHVAATHRIVDVRRKSRIIIVWHELGTFTLN